MRFISNISLPVGKYNKTSYPPFFVARNYFAQHHYQKVRICSDFHNQSDVPNPRCTYLNYSEIHNSLRKGLSFQSNTENTAELCFDYEWKHPVQISQVSKYNSKRVISKRDHIYIQNHYETQTISFDENEIYKIIQLTVSPEIFNNFSFADNDLFIKIDNGIEIILEGMKNLNSSIYYINSSNMPSNKASLVRTGNNFFINENSICIQNSEDIKKLKKIYCSLEDRI